MICFVKMALNLKLIFPRRPTFDEKLQWLRQVKRKRALQGCNHAEGYPGGAHRADD